MPLTWPGIEPATLGIESQRYTNSPTSRPAHEGPRPISRLLASHPHAEAEVDNHPTRLECAVSSTQKFLVQQHITTSKHQANKQLNSKQRQLFLNNQQHRMEFLEKYTQHTIPDESTLRKTYAPSIYDETIQKIRDEIKDSSIWVSIDETPDKEGRLVGNVVIVQCNHELRMNVYAVFHQCAGDEETHRLESADKVQQTLCGEGDFCFETVVGTCGELFFCFREPPHNTLPCRLPREKRRHPFSIHDYTKLKGKALQIQPRPISQDSRTCVRYNQRLRFWRMSLSTELSLRISVTSAAENGTTFQYTSRQQFANHSCRCYCTLTVTIVKYSDFAFLGFDLEYGAQSVASVATAPESGTTS
ncbi:hypothetical protein ANN_12617 [Periplaneta americana]|uniref:Uncharacterized protein n=1 Tax=Periplaneta americana TaxID=6978 RepID=A0ABQ8TH09_PERAM|nr:hypothetical protein ANN_12617 [Periplaneta americana]